MTIGRDHHTATTADLETLRAEIPKAMQQARRWLLWRAVPEPGKPKPRKVPFYVDGTPRHGALDSPADHAQLGTFEHAVAALESGAWTGPGFALGPDGTGNHWQGIDLDNTATRPELAALIDLLPGYVEWSPSGNGVHAVGYGAPFAALGSNASGIEAYSAGRFFTVTGEARGGKVADLSAFVGGTLAPLHAQRGTGTAPQGDDRGVEAVTPGTVTELRSALLHLHADDRDLWVRMGHALRGLGDTGRGLWLDWSATSDKFDPKDAVRVWKSLAGDRTDYRAVFAAAQRAGWVNPMAGTGAPDAAPAAADAQDDPDDKSAESQATALISFAMDQADLFHDLNRDVYAIDRATGETRRIDGRAFRDWLSSGFYSKTKKAPRDQAIREALGTLAGLGRFTAEQHEVFIRIGMYDGAYYLDLAEPGRNRAVRIVPGAWSVVDKAPVRFVRPESMHPLPVPVPGGDLALLWRYANIPVGARLLVPAWLAESMRLDTPFPVAELMGEQGSAKSTTQRVLRRLIDPNVCDLRAAPRSAEDVFVGAGVSWIISYENVSHLPAPMQDALCVLATGGGFAKRKLYTDADESVINVKRPIILNGIGASITAQDLIDRAVSIETPRVHERVEVTDLWRDFEADHPRLLGALLDAFATALTLLPGVRLPGPDQPRLIEFARLGEALALALGRSAGEFLAEFNAARAESIARTIDASPVASALIDWFERRHRQTVELPVRDLFAAVESHKPQGTDAWPRSAKGFGDSLRRAAPALRTLDVEVRSLGKRGGNVVWRVAERKLSNRSPTCPEVLVPDRERYVSTDERQQDGGGKAAQQDIRTCRTSQPEVSFPGQAEAHPVHPKNEAAPFSPAAEIVEGAI